MGGRSVLEASLSVGEEGSVSVDLKADHRVSNVAGSVSVPAMLSGQVKRFNIQANLLFYFY